MSLGDVVGGALGHAAVEAVTDAAPERLPAASNASTAIAYDVPQTRPPTVKAGLDAVPTVAPATETR